MRFWSIVGFVIGFIVFVLYTFSVINQDNIKIGLLYSKTGTLSTEEKVIAQVLHYNIEKINQAGGLLNKKVEIIEYDGKSDPSEFKKGAKYLISKGVKTIFGTWTSSSRKAVKPVVEQNNAILFYPVQYEGVEESKNIIYLGATANQQINPTLSYIMSNFGKDVYIVGSDYIYPRMASVYIGELSKLIGLNILKNDFCVLGDDDFKMTIENIKKLKPKAIINTLNGSSNIAFFEQYHKAKLDPKKMPIFSMSIDESSIKKISDKIGKRSLDGHYATWSYFNSISSKENKDLKEELLKRFGDDFILTDAGYSVHMGVKLWVRSILSSNSLDTQEVLKDIKRDSLSSITGIVYSDSSNNHLYKKMRIGKIDNGDFDIVWESDVLTKPIPFPIFKSKEFWLEEESKLYKKWDNKWHNSTTGASNE